MLNITDADHQNILKLIQYMSLENDLQCINCVIDKDAKISECFTNVNNYVGKHGGQQVLGWKIHLESFMIEAEFHAIWKSPSNEHFDIAPKCNTNEKILFIEDRDTVYKGVPIDNIRLNIANNKLVDDLIYLCKTRFFILNKSDVNLQNGVLIFSSQEAAEQFAGICYLHNHILTMISKKNNYNSPCFCRSQRKYKSCCGKDLITDLKFIINTIGN